jgi:uncharacterized protein (DUF2141 family)
MSNNEKNVADVACSAVGPLRSLAAGLRMPFAKALCCALMALSPQVFASQAIDVPDAEPSAGSEATVSLSVRLSEFRSAEGRVAVALFDTEGSFPDQKKALRGKTVRIDGTTAFVRFDGLKPGVYAVAVLHDENSNDKMDFNLVGMPLEGFGFSNDAKVWLGPPSFDSAAFRLKERGGQIRIKVRYFGL